MTYEEKIALVVLDELPLWQKLNVTAFLAGAVAIRFPETHGAPFRDASGSDYLPFIKHPILVYAAPDAGKLQRAHDRARERDLAIGAYTRALFATRNEEENHAVFAQWKSADGDLAGIVLYGPRKTVDKALDGLKLHP